MKQFFFIFALFSASFAFYKHFPVLGPNLEYGIQGLAAPAGFRGAFVPQANTNFDFAWLEPLGGSGYGIFEPNKTNYIRFFAGAELSPFYGTVRAGIGLAPLPPPFAVLELRFVYSNENMLFSGVEMAMKPGEQPSIKETWNAGYIFDNIYNQSSYSQVQSFDTQLSGKYISRNFDISFLLHFTLIDINSKYHKKDFDYMRGIPLYSRDYVTAGDFSAIYRFGEYFFWDLDFSVMNSGRQLSAPLKKYDKEPLSYYVILTGPSWKFNEDKSCLSLSTGFFTRSSSDENFSDSVREKILLSIQYKYFWDFKFGKK